MNAKELRIGNWVKTCHPNMEIMIPHIFAQVQGITLFHDILFFHTPQVQGFEMPTKHIQGIELTPEILEKAGFGKTEFGSYELENKSFSWDSYRGKMILDLWDGIDLDYVKYLHQLQNIYLLIEGEELEIEL